VKKSNSVVPSEELEVLQRSISPFKGTQQKFDKGLVLELATIALANGDGLGFKVLGDCYSGKISGIHSINPDKAIACYKIAADMGDSDSAKYLIYLVSQGQLPLSEVSDVIRKFSVNEETDPELVYVLGKMYLAQSEIDLAVKHFKISARKDFQDAILALSDIYLQGPGSIDPDPEKAIELLKTLKKKEYAPAMYKLATIYEKGIAGEYLKPKKARKLYKIAAELGYKPATRKLEELDKRHSKKALKKTKDYDKSDFFGHKYLIRC